MPETISYQEPSATIVMDGSDCTFKLETMNRPCNVLIYGGGAVGSVFGWRIAQHSQTKVSVVCRSNYEAVKRSGFSFKTKVWGQGHFLPHHVYRASSLCAHPPKQKFDYVVCANKVNVECYSSIIDELSTVVDANTTIVCAQNGMDVEVPLSHAFPHNSVLSAICNIGCIQPQHGQIHQTAGLHPKAFLVGTYAKGRDTYDVKQKLLVSCDQAFGSVDDVRKQRWRKLLFNSVWNATSALTDFDTHQALAHPKALHLANSIAEEAYQVAIKDGAELGVEYPRAIIDLAASSATITPSTLQDARNRRTMEIDSIWGFLITKAAQCQVQVPTIQMVYDVLLHMNTTFRQPHHDDIRHYLAQIFSAASLPNTPVMASADVWHDDQTVGKEELRRYTLNATAVG